MSGWLSRAKSLFHQQPPPTPEPFEVECDCGGKVVGQRAASYQKPICPVCERPVFVLPLNVYPRPKPKSPPKDKASKPDSDPQPTRPTPNAVVDERPVEVSAKSRERSKSATGRASPVTPAIEPEVLREPRPPLITPLRIVTLAIVLVSGLTGAGLWYRFQIDQAIATVARANDAGMAALRERDFGKAASELEKARRAVDVLRRKDHSAEEIRRFSREAVALSKLAPSSLSEFLQETLSSAKSGQTEPLRMSSLDKDAWVIFDSTVIPPEEGKDRYVIDAPVNLREGTARIEIETPLFRNAIPSSNSGEAPRVIFAAQLDQVMPPTGDPPIAVLILNGKTAFFLTIYDNYTAIGYRPFDEEEERQTKMLLDKQLELLKK